jgi:uncharacterized protein (TIGR00255 family)
MTGYGRATHGVFTVEIQSVNHKFCEISIKLSNQLLLLENKIREYIKEYIARGKIYVFVHYNRTIDNEVKLNHTLAKATVKALRELGQSIGLKDDITLSTLAWFDRSIWRQEETLDVDKLWSELKMCLVEAVNSVINMREIEGEKIKTELANRMKLLQQYLSQIEKIAPDIVKEYAKVLEKRIDMLLDKKVVDEVRLSQEIAIYADKSDITEEIVRAKSHTEQFMDILDKSEPIGRQLDFLIQELHREINTIGAKANNLPVIKIILQAKNELEKIREQIQNVE